MTHILYPQRRIEDYRNDYDNDDDALEAAVTDIRSGGPGSCRIGWNGPLTLTRKPPAMYRVHLEGDDKLGATVRKKYAGGILFDFHGPDDYSGGGLHNLAIPKDEGTANSYLIYYSGANGNCSGLILEHLYLNNGSDESQAPFRSIHIDASARFSPEGFREAVFSNLVLFGTVGANCYIAGATGLSMEKVCTYPAGAGVNGNADFYMVEGVGWQAAENSMSNCQVSKAFRIGNLTSGRFEGTFGSIVWMSPLASFVTVQPRNGRPPCSGIMPTSCRII